MRSSLFVALLLCTMLLPATALATEGRAEPNCLNDTPAAFSSATVIGDGACMKINLGVLTPGDVYDLSIIVSQDALDILVFDQNSIQPYDLGQSYRSSYEQVPSTESALGSFEFHWKVPPSIASKSWFIVFDNAAHSGDQGMGDQGGADSRASLTISKITESYWTPFHDVIALPTDTSSTLLSGDSMRLDAGTTVVVSAWELEGNGDVYLQTQAMNTLYTTGGVGSLFITGASLQSVEDAASFSWVVPNELDGELLYLIADNTDTPVGGADGASKVRMTVRVEFAPPLTPTINDDSNGSTIIGKAVTLDAMSTPNRLNQVASASWDFDAANDANGDGDSTNDADATGWEALAIWSSPGDRTVTLTVTSPIGDSATATTVVSVADVVEPVARIGGNGQPISGGWKLIAEQSIVLNCDGSTDDDRVESCSWNLDGTPYGQNNSVTFSWTDIGMHSVELTAVDPSGNTNSITTMITVTDISLPVLVQATLDLLPSSGLVNDAITCSAAANDVYDPDSSLRYHWDTNPNVDADGNGNARDDADFNGSTTDISFSSAGTFDVVLTVFDQSDNSDSHAFSITVENPPEKGSIAGIFMVVLFIGAVTMGVALIGHRRWQKGIALQLLLGRGLSEAEAKAHLASVSSSRKLPLFSSAAELSGLDAGEVKTASSKAEEAKAAEMAAIYGAPASSVPSQQSAFAPPSQGAFAPPSQGAFAPPTQGAFAPPSQGAFAPPASAAMAVSLGSQAAAADAMALFNDEEPTPQAPAVVQPPTQVVSDLTPTAPVQTIVNSGGISLPEGVLTPQVSAPQQPVSAPVNEPQNAQTQVVCSSCSSAFMIQMPEGVTKVIVACPSCSKDSVVEI